MDERERMLVLGFLAFLFFGLVSIIDGAFTVKAVQPYEWANLRPWLWAQAITLSSASFLIAVASILADNHAISSEDIIGALLLFAQPWILIWGGTLDAISRTTQGYLWSERFGNWVAQTFAWVWLDPQSTSGVPMLPYVLSRVFGSMNTTSYGVLLGSILSIFLVITLWLVYYEYA